METKPDYRTDDGQRNKALWVSPHTHALIKAAAARRGVSIKRYLAEVADPRLLAEDGCNALEQMT